MGKTPATNADMRSTVFDYEWKAVGKERGDRSKGLGKSFWRLTLKPVPIRGLLCSNPGLNSINP